MKLAAFVILCLSYYVHAEDVEGIGSTPMQTKRIADDLSLSVVTQPPANTLHWRITRNQNINKQGLNSVTAGEVVLPGERYCYYWDEKNRIFWFATVRTILKMDISNWSSLKSVMTSTKGFESRDDLPTNFRHHVSSILK